jgi:hypothetical protein
LDLSVMLRVLNVNLKIMFIIAKITVVFCDCYHSRTILVVLCPDELQM